MNALLLHAIILVLVYINPDIADLIHIFLFDRLSVYLLVCQIADRFYYNILLNSGNTDFLLIFLIKKKELSIPSFFLALFF